MYKITKIRIGPDACRSTEEKDSYFDEKRDDGGRYGPTALTRSSAKTERTATAAAAAAD